jgi:hypothetical protein
MPAKKATFNVGDQFSIGKRTLIIWKIVRLTDAMATIEDGDGNQKDIRLSTLAAKYSRI